MKATRISATLKNNRRRSLAILTAAAASAIGAGLAREARGLTTITFNGTTYTQDFDTLPSTLANQSNAGRGPFDVNASPINGPVGWEYSNNAGSTNSSLFRVDNGGSFAGSTYDYGTTSATDRALGSLSSGTNANMFGAVLYNNTVNTYSQFNLSYVVEQWRQGGGAGSVTNITAFSYAVGGTDIATGTFTAATVLDAVSVLAPITGTGSALDGNAAGNRASVNGTVSGLSWAPGQLLVIRWQDPNDAGSDDGLGIDDLSFSATFGSRNLTWNPPNSTWDTVVSHTNWLDGATATNFNANDNATFDDTGLTSGSSVSVTAAGVSAGAVNVTNTSGAYTFSGGPIAGAAALTKTNGGTLRLTVSNTYTGGTALNGGVTVVDGGDNRLGNTAGGVSFDGGSLQVATSALNSARAFSFKAGGGTIDTNSINSTLSGAISGTGNFTKSGSGTLSVTGPWTYSGELAVTTGTLRFGQASGSFNFKAAAGGGGFGGDVVLVNGVRINLNSGTLSGGGTIQVGSAATGASISSTPAAGGTTVVYGNNIVLNGADNTFLATLGGTGSSNTVQVDGRVSGTGSLVFASGIGGQGAARTILNSTNTYSGDSTLNNTYAATNSDAVGYVVLGINNALPPGTNLIFGRTASNVDAGALDLNGKSQSVLTLSQRSGSLANGITNTSSPASLTLTGSSTATATFSGVIGALPTGTNVSSTNNDISLTLASTYGGTLVLTASNGYAGTTTISGGKLVVNGTHSGMGTVTVNSGGTLGGSGNIAGTVTISGGSVTPGNSAGTLSLAGADFSSGGTLKWELVSNTVANPGVNYDRLNITGSGNLTLGGTSTIDVSVLSPATTPDGTGFWLVQRNWKVIDFISSGTSATNFATISGTNSFTGGSFSSQIVGSGADAGDIFLRWTPSNVNAPRVLTWDGNAGTSPNPSDNSGTWNSGGGANSNWYDGVTNVTFDQTKPDYAIFGANGGNSGTTTVTLTSNITVGEIQFETNSNNYLITGNTLTIGGTSTLGATVLNSAEIASTVVLSGAKSFDVAASQSLTFSGAVSGSRITKNDNGSLVLSNSGNTYAGLTITAGSAVVGSNGAMGNNSDALILSGGTLQASASFNSASRAVTINAGGTIDTNSNTVTLGGILSGTGALSKTGIGTLRLTNGSNSNSGGIAVHGVAALEDSVLSVPSDAALGSGGVSFGDQGGSLALDSGFTSAKTFTLLNGGSGGAIRVGAGTATLSGTLTGNAAFAKTGAGTLVLSGLTTATPRQGTTEIVGGLVVLSNVDSNKTPMIGIGNTTVDTGAILEINGVQIGQAATTFAPIITLNDGSTLRGRGTSETIRSGSPKIVTTGTPSVTIGSLTLGSTFTLGASVRNDVASVANSPATIHVTGPGIVWLASGATSTSTSADHYTGAWSIDSGILQVGPIEPGGAGEPLNALGYYYGSDTLGTGNSGGGSGTGPQGGATEVTINAGGTLAGGIDNAGDTKSYSNHIILNGGSLGSTQLADAAYSGNLTVKAGLTSTITLTDPENGTTPRNVRVISNAFTPGNLTYEAGSTLRVSGAGELTFARTSGTVSVSPTTPTLQVDSGATMNLDGTMRVTTDGTNHVNLIANGTVKVLPNGLTTVVKTLTIGAAGNFDIGDDKAVVDYTGSGPGDNSPSATIRTYLINGRGGVGLGNASWAGTGGITSSAAVADTDGLAVGYREAQPPDFDIDPVASFGGQTVDDTAVLMRYTYSGDANLDGLVDRSDLLILQNSFNQTSGVDWLHGDFDYNGTCDRDDLQLLSNNYGNPPIPSSGSLTASFGSDFAASLAGSRAAAVPEPAGLGLLGLASALGLLRRRRRAVSGR